MPGERTQRQIDRLLDEAEDGIRRLDWGVVRDRAAAVLALDPENADGLDYLAAADRAAPGAASLPRDPEVQASPPSPKLDALSVHPASFCDGRYEVRRFLGEGGKKRVYLAHDARLDRDVAFALIKTEGLDAEGQVRVRREAQAMGRLGDNPHIVAIYDIGEERDQPFIVSQLMPGGDVEGLISRAEGHRPPLAQAIAIADQVCQALEYAHTHDIVHRDLKPGNVWLAEDGAAKLGDFGLALSLDRSRLTQAGMMVGTVHYMPPEQALGGEVTPRSDLYSLGAMLYEMATGRPPFVGDESVAIITQHLNTAPVAPSWHAPDLPPGLEALILRLLEKDPAKRPASASEVRQALTGIMAPNPTPPPTARPEPAEGLREGQPGSGGSPLPTLGEGSGVRASNPLYRRTFVGRETELRQLQTAFDTTLSGQGAFVTVVGEPGIGKTALCEQLATYVAVRGGRPLVGHCYEEGSLSLPYLAFVEALRAYVLSRDPEGLRADLGSGATDVARIVSEIRERVGLTPAPNPQSAAPTPGPEDDRWRLFQAVTAFLQNASRVQPLLIVLEDLHWADRGTLDLLVHLSRNLQGARLLLLGTYRDVEVDRSHPLSPALAELRRGPTFERVTLRGLRIPEVQRMLAAIAGREAPASVAEAVHRQTEGNPLFVQEVARYLVEEGLLSAARDDGSRRVTDSTPIAMSIPEGLRDVIGKRLSRLSPECNRLLATAAVIGREFALETLRTVATLDEETLVRALEDAVRVGVLEEEARMGVVRYRFTHAFFRQTLYEELSAPRRIQLHQHVAGALEAQYTASPVAGSRTRLGEHAAELAEHFAHSSDRADLMKAVMYGEMAAHRATAVYAYGETARLLEGALEVQEVLDPDDRSRRCDLLLALGEALPPAGDPLRAAGPILSEAYALAEAEGDRARAFRASNLALGALAFRGRLAIGRTPEYQEWVARADRAAAPESAERVVADTHLAQVHYAMGRNAQGAVLGRDAVDLARHVGDPEAFFFSGYRGLIFSFAAPERQPERLRLAEELARCPRQGVSARYLAAGLFQSGHTLLANGQRERAEELWRQMTEIAQRTQDATTLLLPLEIEIILATLDSELERAAAAVERLDPRMTELGMEGAGQSALYALRPCAYLGRETLAQLVVDRHYPSGDATRAALCLAYLGRLDEARAALERSRQAIDESLEGEGNLSAHVIRLEAAVLLADRNLAARILPRVADCEHLLAGTYYDSTCVARHLGAAAALLGDGEAARRYTERAIAVSSAVRHRPEIALSRLQLAELLLAEAVSHGPSAISVEQSAVSRSSTPAGGGAGQQMADKLKAEGSAHLDFAIAEFRAMNMQPALERALKHKGLLSA